MENESQIQKVLEKLATEQLIFAPDTGHIRLFDQRMLLIPGKALAEFRSEMIKRFGEHEVQQLLTRAGYQRGIDYYHKLRSLVGDDPDLLIGSAMRLAELEGYVYHQPIAGMQVNFDQGIFQGDYQWHSSWEAEAHNNHFGVSSEPICWMMTGYASGFSTAMFGRPVLWREIECCAMGHKACRVVGKPLEEWDDEENLAQFLQSEAFVDLPKQKVSKPKDTASLKDKPPLTELVGASVRFNHVVHLLKKVAPVDTSVLLLGESGVGKERFSKALHDISKRHDGPCISVNCAAIPTDLVEAELFGVEKGAFTGATNTRAGRFERAHKGTLFLDEIGSLPLAAQGKLLRAIQEGEIERVGGADVISVDVRIVAATNNNLRRAVEDGEFRADLFYRLNVYPIEIPALRDRREDIPLLFHVFLDRYCQKADKKIAGITRRALDALWHYHWPGNVRELENLVERAVILADEGKTIDTHHLFNAGEMVETNAFTLDSNGHLQTSPVSEQTALPDQTIEHLLDQNLSLEALEESIIVKALARTNGNISAAARLLKMGRGQLQYRLSKLETTLKP
ncbi:sigma 54-interacting transcriptional regulator [Halioxenophilus aromaticivorans]|uniref:Sigma-54-dependent Fis family transcriptional regulator n=1 Tax=Halioxenophilus aromaticivorans TaxID=1306992 RepID=A0AAV3U9U3_9ALTE